MKHLKTALKYCVNLFGILSSGYVLSIFIVNVFSPNHIPSRGKWSMLYLGQDLSIQMETTTLVKSPNTLKIWLREDRLESFVSSQGIKGTTVFSEVSINCKNKTVSTHKQIAYDSNLIFSEQAEGSKNFDTPKGTMELIATIILCQIPVPDDEAKQPNERMLT